MTNTTLAETRDDVLPRVMMRAQWQRRDGDRRVDVMQRIGRRAAADEYSQSAGAGDEDGEPGAIGEPCQSSVPAADVAQRAPAGLERDEHDEGYAEPRQPSVKLSGYRVGPLSEAGSTRCRHRILEQSDNQDHPEDDHRDEGEAALAPVERLCARVRRAHAAIEEWDERAARRASTSMTITVPQMSGSMPSVAGDDVHAARPADGEGRLEAEPAGILVSAE